MNEDAIFDTEAYRAKEVLLNLATSQLDEATKNFVMHLAVRARINHTGSQPDSDFLSSSATARVEFIRAVKHFRDVQAFLASDEGALLGRNIRTSLSEAADEQ